LLKLRERDLESPWPLPKSLAEKKDHTRLHFRHSQATDQVGRSEILTSEGGERENFRVFRRGQGGEPRNRGAGEYQLLQDLKKNRGGTQ